uniref:(northern house mosquito) hypothetical protein n=1 Tax=Culex pipiens TaxID=7175 RepID=A0A8D8BYU7_CULPI
MSAARRRSVDGSVARFTCAGSDETGVFLRVLLSSASLATLTHFDSSDDCLNSIILRQHRKQDKMCVYVYKTNLRTRLAGPDETKWGRSDRSRPSSSSRLMRWLRFSDDFLT